MYIVKVDKDMRNPVEKTVQECPECGSELVLVGVADNLEGFLKCKHTVWLTPEEGRVFLSQSKPLKEDQPS